MSTPFAQVLQRLYEKTGYAPRGSAGQKSARCPAHDDSRPSLSVGVGGDGVVKLRCHGGPQCPTEDIVAALDLPMSALWPDELRGQQRRSTSSDEWVPCHERGHKKVAEYRYTDEHGTVLYGVTRCDRKCFAQWRPDPSKKYGRRWSLRDDHGNKVRSVPYRLPEVLAAVREERVVWICEGEKDVEALRARPLITATTNQGGAGMGWPDDFHQYFQGADVTIVADRDEGGRKHATNIVNNLLPAARSIYVVQSAHGKDAFDHLAGGGTTGDFITVWEPKPFTYEGMHG